MSVIKFHIMKPPFIIETNTDQEWRDMIKYIADTYDNDSARQALGWKKVNHEEKMLVYFDGSRYSYNQTYYHDWIANIAITPYSQFKTKTMKNWNIQVSTVEQFNEVLDYLKSIGKRVENHHYKTIMNHDRYISISGEEEYDWGYNGAETDDFSKKDRITWEQFQELKGGSKGKIVGYKAPYDLFGGDVKKDSIFTLVKSVNGVKENSFYAHGSAAKTTSYSRHIPKEIVETWEPVYEEVLTPGDWLTVKKAFTRGQSEFKVGQTFKTRDGGEEFQIADTAFFIKGAVDYLDHFRKATPQEIEKAQNVVVAGHTMEIEEGRPKFGCRRINKSTLEELRNLMTYLGDQVSVSLNIGGTEVTAELLDKILKRLP